MAVLVWWQHACKQTDRHAGAQLYKRWRHVWHGSAHWWSCLQVRSIASECTAMRMWSVHVWHGSAHSPLYHASARVVLPPHTRTHTHTHTHIHTHLYRVDLQTAQRVAGCCLAVRASPRPRPCTPQVVATAVKGSPLATVSEARSLQCVAGPRHEYSEQGGSQCEAG